MIEVRNLSEAKLNNMDEYQQELENTISAKNKSISNLEKGYQNYKRELD